MNYKILWTNLALNSYDEEIDYIFFKWNLKEVLKFESLVTEEIKRISINPFIGKPYYNQTCSLSISKQTTLIYRINKDSKVIELLVFWNNQKNPAALNKLL